MFTQLFIYDACRVTRQVAVILEDGRREKVMSDHFPRKELIHQPFCNYRRRLNYIMRTV